MAGNKGYTRRKSRSQAQQEIQWGQRRFDGAQNSDTVASKIGDYDVALSINTVHTASDIQGHWGRKLLSPAVTPGSGRLHQVCQHSKTGRWLVHRGNKFWLSTGRDGTGWLEVTPLGPDGSLSATGSFSYSDGAAAVTGDAAAFLSNMILGPLIFGQTYSVTITDNAGFSFTINVFFGDELVAEQEFVYADTPANVPLDEVGGSGISGTVDVSTLTPADLPVTGVVTAVANTPVDVPFSLRGLTLENTDNWQLWWKLTITAGEASITIYKDAAMTDAVAECADFIEADDGTPIFYSLNGSGISGSAAWPGGDYPPGVYAGTALTFASSESAIDADSTIAPYGDTGFVVFVRSTVPKNIYVEQSLEKYWLISTTHGYGIEQLYFPMTGLPYKYRYLYTYSRIVDANKAPDYTLNRTTGLLQFEGPSNLSSIPLDIRTDYSEEQQAAPISGTDPSTVSMALGSTDVRANAADYITHVSIYRTLDVGVNGIGLNGAANNSEVYIWVADVPIYTASYSDTTDDTTLRNRYVGASSEQDSLALRGRLFREMACGIGAIGPDFMVTSEPQGQQASYCDLAANPRMIGFNFPGTQRFILQDPISEIYRTKDLFVFICPSSTYTSISSIQSETGIAGLIPILEIENFQPASRTIGIKYGQGVFPVDESSFITLCTDGTIRIFSASSWSDPLEGTRLHGITSQVGVGAVFSFFRNVMLMWGRTGAIVTVSGPAAAVLSDLSITGFAGDFLYGRIEPVGGGDAYSVAFYSDADRTVEVARGPSGVSPITPQTVIISQTGDSGVSGSVFAAPFGTTLPSDFIVDFRQISNTCIRFSQGGPNGSNWTEVSRPYWAAPSQWCGAMLVEDEDAALRVAVFDAYDNAVFAVEDALPLRQFEDDTVTTYPSGPVGDITEFISAMTLTGSVTPATSYDVVIAGITPDTFGVYIVSGVTTLAQYEGPVAGQPLVGAVLTPVGGSGISGTFSISGFTGGYVYGTVNTGGVVASGLAEIPSLVRLRELTGKQENDPCSHEESHIAFRPRYGQTDLPAGLLVTVRGYANGILEPGATTTVPPTNTDIQFFAPVEGDRIQIEYETNKSGWRITSFDTRYQSQDMQSENGPWNGQESDYQDSLGDGLVSWVYGSSGLVDRASPVNAAYPGALPADIAGPSDTFYGQYFTSAIERAIAASLQDYTLMVWVLGPAIGPAAVQVAPGLYIAFPASGFIDVGGMGVVVNPEVATGNGWQHFAIVREGLVRTIYQNGVAIASEDVDGALVDVVSVILGTDGQTQPMCDIRLYENAKGADVLGYYYNDVATNGGNKVLP